MTSFMGVELKNERYRREYSGPGWRPLVSTWPYLAHYAGGKTLHGTDPLHLDWSHFSHRRKDAHGIPGANAARNCVSVSDQSAQPTWESHWEIDVRNGRNILNLSG